MCGFHTYLISVRTENFFVVHLHFFSKKGHFMNCLTETQKFIIHIKTLNIEKNTITNYVINLEINFVLQGENSKLAREIKHNLPKQIFRMQFYPRKIRELKKTFFCFNKMTYRY